jgi:hypothetical protein
MDEECARKMIISETVRGRNNDRDKKKLNGKEEKLNWRNRREKQHKMGQLKTTKFQSR